MAPRGDAPTSAPRPPDASGPGRPAIGRTTPLDVDEILAAAHALVAEHGIEALSMRRLAQRLGVTPMALYHHLPNKPAIVWALCEQVWARSVETLDIEADDLVEWLVAFCVHLRRIWLEHLELAPYGMAVAEPDEAFVDSNRTIAALIAAAGFPDVPLAFGAMQTFTFGSIATTANRRTASAYFGRDPQVVRKRALTAVGGDEADPDVLGVVESRFDERDEANFEPGLRALLRGLLAG